MVPRFADGKVEAQEVQELLQGHVSLAEPSVLFLWLHTDSQLPPWCNKLGVGFKSLELSAPSQVSSLLLGLLFGH